ncbi:MAG: PilZ domain-containing protein [Thermoanaerobaculia bacterium]|nr:PilZ domain-containing protein [Thermoanaerobaculia bacterium]
MSQPDGERYDRRASHRHRFTAPVFFETGVGTTRDLSATGVYFETASEIEPGPIRFSVELDSDSEGTILMKCKGSVVRIDESASRRGVAARIGEIDF